MIGRLREGTAAFTDERVRLEGEAVGGALAMKMLGWEPWLMAAIGAPRNAWQILSKRSCCDKFAGLAGLAHGRERCAAGDTRHTWHAGWQQRQRRSCCDSVAC